jgi:hypothetical protein
MRFHADPQMTVNLVILNDDCNQKRRNGGATRAAARGAGPGGRARGDGGPTPGV